MKNQLPQGCLLVCLACCLFLLESSFFSPSTFAQQNVAVASPTSPQTLDEWIYSGKELEREGRWGEALSHYQQALKFIPDDPQIKTRRSIARIHFDLGRRYSDSNYVQSLSSLQATQSLNLYAEVLHKVQSYYVDEPNWDNILRHGLASMEIALTNPTFLNTNLPGIEQQRVQDAIDRMNSVLTRQSAKNRQDVYTIASNVCSTIQRDIGLPIQTSMIEFVSGAIIALDPYSSFMTSSQYGETMSQIEGNFVGLGVELRTEPNALHIVGVIAGGPASQAGVQSGDFIIGVNQRTVEQMGSEKAADALRGPEGSFISLTIQTAAGDTKSVRMQRKRVEIPSVENVRFVDSDHGIGYIQLTNFQKTTVRDFDAALWKLQREGMNCLIVDVRGNPGGLLNSAVEISNRFVSGGVIVSTRGRNSMENYVHRAHPAGTWSVPLIVLVDENSASASEIFAATIRDHERGVVVGKQTYGKGSVQGIFPLDVGGGGVRLTTAKFYSPNNTAISQRGVVPHITVQTTAKPTATGQVNPEEDDILRAGIQAAIRRLNVAER